MKKIMRTVMAAALAFICGCATEPPKEEVVVASELIERLTLNVVSNAFISSRLDSGGGASVILFNGIGNNTAVNLDDGAINWKILQEAKRCGRTVVSTGGDLNLKPSATMKIDISQYDRLIVKSEILSRFAVRITIVDLASGLKIYEKQRLVAVRHNKYDQLM